MIDRLFTWLERYRDPFPPEEPVQPPSAFWPFVYHYTRPFRGMIIASASLAALIALLEVSLFAFMGRLVDWLAAADRATFWEQHGTFLLVMAALVILVLPALKFIYEAVVHQGIMGNFAMRARWLAHRYVLRQSMSFFQNDFAGRISQKVMQTSLSLREVVMKITEVMVYVSVYFTEIGRAHV